MDNAIFTMVKYQYDNGDNYSDKICIDMKKRKQFVGKTRSTRINEKNVACKAPQN
jgi:hypothetical protein